MEHENQRRIIPNVAKTGGLQRQGVKGEAVVDYCEPLATKLLTLSGFPEEKKDGEK